MSTLSALKLVIGKNPRSVSPVVHRRNKLVAKLHEQLQLCEARKNGQTYTATKLKKFTHKDTGERIAMEVPKKIKEWFWTNDAGKINLAIKYGAKTLPLNKKGANAVEVANLDELIKTLAELKTATLNGELDEAINEVSTATRMAFKK